MRLHLFQFANEAAAIADPLIGAYYLPPDLPPEDPDYLPGTWSSGAVSFPTLVSLDSVPVSGFWVIFSSEDESVAENAACRVAWDNENSVVLGGTYTGNEIAVLHVSPIPSGSYCPWP